jgi:hypothetical protein
MKIKGLAIGVGVALLLILVAYLYIPRAEVSVPAITLDDIMNPPKFSPSKNPLEDVKKSERIQHSQKSFLVDTIDRNGSVTTRVEWESPDRLRTMSEPQEEYQDVQIGLTHYQKVPGSQWTETTERSTPECPGVDFLVDSAIRAQYLGKVQKDGWEVYGYNVFEPKNQAQSDSVESAVIWISVKDGLPRQVEVLAGHRSYRLLYGNYNDNLAVIRPR